MTKAAAKLPPLSPKSPGIPPKPRYREQYGLIVICRDEADQAALYQRLAGGRIVGGRQLKVVVT